MNMKKVFRYSTIAIMGLALVMAVNSGCGKDDKISTSELLTSHPWTFVKAMSTSTDTTVQQGVALINAFMTNVEVTFNVDGTYTLTSPLINDPETGTWELSSDEKLLTIKSDGDSDADVNRITRISDAELVLEEDDTTDDGTPYTITLTFKKSS
jgi:hypothetical protein